MHFNILNWCERVESLKFQSFFSLYLLLDANCIQNALKKTFSQSICSQLNFLQLLCCEQVQSVDFRPLPKAWICPRKKKNLARVGIWLILLASKIRIQINGSFCPLNLLDQVLPTQHVWYKLSIRVHYFFVSLVCLKLIPNFFPWCHIYTFFLVMCSPSLW